MGSDIEKALALYDRPDIHDCILDFNNEEHVQAAQQVIAAFPGAVRRALAAEARVKELERVHPALTQTATALGCSFCGKPREETRFLIAGLKVYICDECLDLCNRIADDMKLKASAEEVSEAREELTVQYGGDGVLDVAVRPKYLRDALAVGTARSDAKDIAMLRGLVTDQVKEGCMCRDRQQLVKAGDRLAVLLGDRDYIGAREDWEQAKNGGDREC